MAAASCRRDAQTGHTPRPGLAVCELLAAFGVVVALALLLIPALPASPAATTGPTEKPVFRLHNALMNLQLGLETGMIETYDGWFHAAGDRPLIIDVFPGIDTSAAVAAEADADCSELCVDHDAAS